MPTSNDRRKLASRTRGLEAATASQIVLDGVRGRMRYAEPGEVECPVCQYPAVRSALDDRGFRYVHLGRALFPCRSSQASLTGGELLHPFDPNLTSVQAHYRLKDGPGV